MNRNFSMNLLNPAKIFTKILDAIYPHICPICGREADFSSLCENCAKAYINGHRSFVSEIKFGERTLKIFAIDIFNEETAKIIHHLKYDSIKTNATDILRFGLTTFYDSLSKADLITFIPLHPLRFLRRGYNQAAVLAKIAGADLDISCKRTMYRKRYNITQTKKNAKKRKLSVINLFGILKKANVSEKIIILVDDVCTTGSTIGECAEILYKAGAKEVILLVLAKVQ